MINDLLIKVASARIMPSRLVPECDPTGPSEGVYGVATGPLPTCDICFLAQVGHNIIMTLIYAAFVIVTIMAITGGFRMFFSGGNPEAAKTARKHITSALIGLLIVLFSWVGLNLFFTTFTHLGSSWYVATPIDCRGVHDSCITKCSVRYTTAEDIAECELQCP